jgi:hypothetical protein
MNWKGGTMSDARLEMPSGVHEALWQMFKDGPVWDGNLVCKTSRKWLIQNGFAQQSSGFNFLTSHGVDMAVSLEMDCRKRLRTERTDK